MGWSQPNPRLVLGQLLWIAPNQTLLCFSSQYYEMSYGLNIEMHKQVSAGGGLEQQQGRVGKRKSLETLLKMISLEPCSSNGSK